METNELTRQIIHHAMKIHTAYGPGLLESAYKELLFYELKKAGFVVEKEKPIPLIHDELKLEVGYRADLVVEGRVIVELKAQAALAPIVGAQCLTYMRLAKLPVCLLINFHVEHLRDGVKRFVM